MDRYLIYKEYREFKRDVLDPLEEFIKQLDKNLKKSQSIINGLYIEEYTPGVFNLIENDLLNDSDYQVFCETALLEFDKEVRECEINKFKIDERIITI